MIYSMGFGAQACLAAPSIIEMHGSQHMGTVYGLMMLGFGVGASLSAPLAGKTRLQYVINYHIFYLSMYVLSPEKCRCTKKIGSEDDKYCSFFVLPFTCHLYLLQYTNWACSV